MNLYTETFRDVDGKETTEWCKFSELLETVKWARVYHCPSSRSDEEPVLLSLKSSFNEVDLNNFLNGMKSIDYDSGYGCQEVYGNIVYKDGTWLSREEYDGSEWWQYNSTPLEPEYKEIV